MARHPFGGTIWDWVMARQQASPVAQAVAGLVTSRVNFYDAATGGTHLVDLQDAAGAPLAAVDTDNNGFLPTFYGPDNVTSMWADAGTGGRKLMVARDSMGPAGPASTVPGPPGGSDAAQAGWINDPASATRAALSATIATQAVTKTKARGTATEHVAELMETLDLGLRSVGIGVVTDSTGFSASANRWPYLLGQRLGTRYPAYTVRHHPWNPATSDYDAPTVIQTGASGTRYASFTATSMACIPDSSVVDFGTQLDVRIKVALDSWTPGSEVCLFSKYGGAGNRSWRFSFGSGWTNNLLFECSSDGTGLVTHSPNAAWTKPADGAPIWLRATFNGAAGADRQVAFYTSSDGVTWTQIGTTITAAGGALTLFNSSAELQCGGRGGYANGGGLGAGKVYETQVRSSIGGPVVAPVMVENWPLQMASGVRALLPVSGAPVLNIVNAAQSGASVIDMYPNVAKRLHNYSQKVVFLASSHNDTGGITPNQWHTGDSYLALWDTLLTNAQAQLPGASYVLITENPRTAPATLINDHAIRLGLQVGWARRKGLGIIDVYRAFQADSRGLGVLVNSDGIHPSDADGSVLWTDTVEAELLKRGS